MRLWFLTNGYGEDRAGALIASELRARRSQLDLVAAPLVTPGLEFAARHVAVAMAGTAPPSGGFPTASVRTLLRDLPSVPAYFGYARRLRRLVRRDDQFVAAGDVFLTGLARLAFGRAGVHVALAKSVHGQPHSRIERALLRRWARLVIVRDEATAAHLESHAVRAVFLGNPLVDHLPAATPAGSCPRVLLLPGSRAEAPANMVKLLEVVARVNEPVEWVCAWPGAVPIESGVRAAAGTGWAVSGYEWSRGDRTVVVLPRQFDSVVAGADIVVGLAGTANEQAASLGKPVVTFEGCGPQTTAARMLEQARLLGNAARFVRGGADEVAAVVSGLLRSPAERRRLGALGSARLGPPGGAGRIAACLIDEFGL